MGCSSTAVATTKRGRKAVREADPNDARLLEGVEGAHAAVGELERRGHGRGAGHERLDLGKLLLGRRAQVAQRRVHVARVHPAKAASRAAQAGDGLGGRGLDLVIGGDGDEQAHKKLNYNS